MEIVDSRACVRDLLTKAALKNLLLFGDFPAHQSGCINKRRNIRRSNLHHADSFVEFLRDSAKLTTTFQWYHHTLEATRSFSQNKRSKSRKRAS